MNGKYSYYLRKFISLGFMCYGAFGVLFGAVGLISSLSSSFVESEGLTRVESLFISATVGLLHFVLMKNGLNTYLLLKKSIKYKSVLSACEEPNVSICKLAEVLDFSKEQVLKELEKFIKKNILQGVFIDYKRDVVCISSGITTEMQKKLFSMSELVSEIQEKSENKDCVIKELRHELDNYINTTREQQKKIEEYELKESAAEKHKDINGEEDLIEAHEQEILKLQNIILNYDNMNEIHINKINELQAIIKNNEQEILNLQNKISDYDKANNLENSKIEELQMIIIRSEEEKNDLRVKLEKVAKLTDKAAKIVVNNTIKSIEDMSGHDFEYFCASLLKASGFVSVRVTPGSGDQGVDIIAEKEGVKYAFQCKNYSHPLGNTPVQEVHAGKYFYNCDVGVVITNSSFTTGAMDLAKATGILLWDNRKIRELVTDNIDLFSDINAKINISRY